MDLGRNIQANDQGLFVVTFFNKREQDVTEATLKYVFSKFGQLADIKYSEHGRVFISYKEKEGAFKALEIMNMGTKYHVETDWQPVKKIETVQSTKSEKEDPFIYLRIPKMGTDGTFVYIRKTLFCYEERSKIKDVVFSYVFDYHAKIVFDSKVSKEEIRKKHQENPFKWPKGFGNFEFCQDLPIAYLICPEPNLTISFWGPRTSQAIFGKKKSPKIKKIHIPTMPKFPKSKVMKVIFDTKVTKDVVMEAHKRKPFKWPENFGVFEFLNTSEVFSMVGRIGSARRDEKKED